MGLTPRVLPWLVCLLYESNSVTPSLAVAVQVFLPEAVVLHLHQVVVTPKRLALSLFCQSWEVAAYA